MEKKLGTKFFFEEEELILKEFATLRLDLEKEKKFCP